MGKIVKYCSTCEEGFSEKFSFCPNCANELSAYEMKPVASEPEVVDELDDKPAVLASAGATEIIPDPVIEPVAETIEFSQEVVEEVPQEVLEPAAEETVFEPVSFEAEDDEAEMMLEEFENEAEEEEVAVPVGKKAAVVAATVSSVTTLFGAEGIPDSGGGGGFKFSAPTNHEYGVTVVNDSSGSLRKSLMLGATTLVLLVAFGSLLYSIFNHPFFVASIGDDYLLAPPVIIEPMQVEEEKPKEDNDKDSGGGGGGGTERKVEASKGEPPSQTRDRIPPLIPLEMKENPELAHVNKTEGDNIKKRTQRIGLGDGIPGDLSGGTGRGGGMGSGRGTGVGSGRGTGEGSGVGSGRGSGIGSGTGSGRGSGRPRVSAKPPKPKPKGPTVGIKIQSKPRPGYTDSARQNNVQGTVMLRVTFSANGRIGRVSPVKGLPHGLTEKAIAAARRIRFVPAKRNGVPYSITKRIQYNFTIY